MGGWLVSVQKPGTYEVRLVVVAAAEEAAAETLVRQACAGLPAVIRPVKPVDAAFLQLHGLAPGALQLLRG